MSTVSIIIQIVGSDPASQQIAMPWESKVRHVAEVYIQYFRIAMYVERKKHLTPWWSSLQVLILTPKSSFSIFMLLGDSSASGSGVVSGAWAFGWTREKVSCSLRPASNVRLPMSPPRNIREWSQNPSVFFGSRKRLLGKRNIYPKVCPENTLQ